ncbi:MAG: GNAT family N-acetyltransferase [Streptosporangiaceae bacterium]|jgi:Fic family protein/ribosomal protein S18 acetylase RimI-like enzyme
MSRVIHRHWPGNPDALSRRGRLPCDYDAYIPDQLAGRRFTFDSDVAADAADAEVAMARLNAEALALADTEALARLLLRAESVASSRIEGLEVGARRLLRAEAAKELGERFLDITAAEVLGNINAMNAAIFEVGAGDPITLDVLLGFHRRLLADTRLAAQAGRLRDKQNWIGGSDYSPCSAAFVPPPPELVPDLMADLCSFCNDESLPAVAQAAIAHAQFETIHPFPDGNGRTGRGLIHLVLRRRGLAPRVLPLVSLVLATWAKDYVDGLAATRYRGPAMGKAAQTGLNMWVGTFAGACRRAVEDASSFEQRIEQIQREWRARLGRIRGGSAADLLLRSLVGAPVLTVASAADLIGRSFPQTNDAVERLVSADVLSQVRVGRRNRVFEAPAIINAFTDLERQLASPAGDTRSSEPVRPVPPRKPGPLLRLARARLRQDRRLDPDDRHAVRDAAWPARHPKPNQPFITERPGLRAPPPITGPRGGRHTGEMIRLGTPADLAAARGVYRRASLSNAGDRDNLLAHPEYLILGPEGLAEGRTHVAEQDSTVVGFASWADVDGVIELEDLFVDPDYMRRGIATELVSHVAAAVRARGVERLEVTANPHAMAFYHSAGFVDCGVAETEFYPGTRMVLMLS